MDAAYERHLRELEAKRAPAIARAQRLIADAKYDQADQLILSADDSIHGLVALGRLYESALRDLVAQNRHTAQPDLARTIFERALRWKHSAYPDPHTQCEADDFSRGRQEDRRRLVEILGYDPADPPAPPPPAPTSAPEPSYHDALPGAIFQLERIEQLPLWAQVLIASRAARRAALSLPESTPAHIRSALAEACDQLDTSAKRGDFTAEARRAGKRASAIRATRATEHAIESLRAAADAALAANDSLDFSAAERACTTSTFAAIARAAESPGLSPLQMRIFAASDLDQLRFACGESRIGRYDGLGLHVLSRMAPVHPPRQRGAEPPPPGDLSR
jgi:hypothetical protein